MPQSLAYGLDVDTCLEEERGVGVTQTVKSNRGHYSKSADPALEPSADHIRVVRGTSGPAEDEVQIIPVGGAACAAIESLALLLFAQQRNRLLVDIDRADALPALWRTKSDTVPLSGVLLSHRQPGSVEVDVTPPDAEQLATPHSCGRGYVVQGELAILRGESQKCCKFVRRPGLDLWSILRSGMRSLGRVASQQAVIESILQCLMEADVDVVHRLLAKAALGQLPIKAPDLKSIDSLQSHFA